MIIGIENVTVTWRDRTTLSNVSLNVDRGDFMAVTGPNGGGKTTLLRVLLKLLKPTEGRVTYYDADGKPTDRLSIGYLPQKNVIDSRFPITVSDLVSSGLMAQRHLPRAEARELTHEMIERIGLSSHTNAVIGTLSGGQMQRALLGRALISRPELLVLDEPLSYLDKQFEQRVYDILREASRSATIVLVSHEMSVISALANRHVIVDREITHCHAAHHAAHYDCDEG